MKKYAIVGPPNVGKSTLFYRLTGVYVKTANYPGTTVEVHRGRFRHNGVEIELVDLPGVLRPESPVDEDEKVAMREAMYGPYDGVVVVVAPHAVDTGLKLAHLLSRHRPVALVFNMADIWRPEQPPEEMSKMFGVPVVYVSAAKREGLSQLKELLASGFSKSELRLVKLEPPRHVAVGSAALSHPAVAAAFILALGVFTTFLLMLAIEGVTPWGAELPFSLSKALEGLDAAVSSAVESAASGFWDSFILLGLWDALLTLFTISLYVAAALVLITLYEDSGLIGVLSKSLERRLISLGIPPRGVVCLFVGASCNVPASETVRVLWGRGNRVLTALLVPYVPCVARLAVFTAVAAAALAKTPYLIPAAVLTPYFISFAAVVAASKLYRSVLKIPSEAIGGVPPSPVMVPNLSILLRKVAAGLAEFFRRAAPPLVAVLVAVVWPLSHFGPSGYVEDISQSYLAEVGRVFEPAMAPLGLSWEVAVPLVAGWVFKEVVLGLLEATGGLSVLAEAPLASVLAFLVFTAFYSACVATMFSMAKTVGWRLTALSVVVNLSMAYAAASAVYLGAALLLGI